MLRVIDLAVIADVLRASYRIVDNGSIFNYTEKAREETLQRIMAVMIDTDIELQPRADKE